MKYDVVIIGAGVAGLYAAINLPRDKHVLVINKAYPWECNTYYAQGGVTTAYDEDDIDLHVKDTMYAGAGMCNRDAVEVMSRGSLEVIDDLISHGFEFDKADDGSLLYTKEAAHSRDRILHAGGDATGRYLHYFLLKQNPHPMLSNATVIDILIENEKCCGVVVEHEGKIKSIEASHVVIASGGVGSLYEYHTNARSISGDLHGICVEKGIALEYMEMMQFHPTVYVGNDSAQKQLLTEALRGEGAHIVDDDGRRFLFEYDDKAELAARDIVSHSIYDYTQRTGKQAYLSFDTFDEPYFRKRFPNIFSALNLLGFKVPYERVPISPAFHYAIGGIKTSLDGEVEEVEGLYAIGEAASTGVHGANRLASNSLLEGLVFSKRASQKILQSTEKFCTELPAMKSYVLREAEDKVKKGKLRSIMWDNVSIARSKAGLREAKREIDVMLSEKVGRLLKLRLLTAGEMIASALRRSKSIGVHTISNEGE
ncbi:MAG: L-aspartate oxidase [Campylobacterota bacterium]|nr:L-aspartate oxidase [Campylobacterota bacterium]